MIKRNVYTSPYWIEIIQIALFIGLTTGLVLFVASPIFLLPLLLHPLLKTLIALLGPLVAFVLTSVVTAVACGLVLVVGEAVGAMFDYFAYDPNDTPALPIASTGYRYETGEMFDYTLLAKCHTINKTLMNNNSVFSSNSETEGTLQRLNFFPNAEQVAKEQQSTQEEYHILGGHTL